MTTSHRIRVTALIALILLAMSPAPSAAGVPRFDTQISDRAHPLWAWPLAGSRQIVEEYRAPAHTYGAGHRGVDLATAVGVPVYAPAGGIVAFRGTVVDRPLLTLEHPDGYVSTFEPLDSTLVPGDVVAVGDPLGTVDSGGHARDNTLHLGVRLDGAYLNPMLLFGEVPRSVLLPCCAPL